MDTLTREARAIRVVVRRLQATSQVKARLVTTADSRVGGMEDKATVDSHNRGEAVVMEGAAQVTTTSLNQDSPSTSLQGTTTQTSIRVAAMDSKEAAVGMDSKVAVTALSTAAHKVALEDIQVVRVAMSNMEDHRVDQEVTQGDRVVGTAASMAVSLADHQVAILEDKGGTEVRTQGIKQVC